MGLVALVGSVTAVAAVAQGGSAQTLSPQGYACQLVANPSPLDFDQFCSQAAGCWPAAWLLGAQKAATTSLVDLLEVCGINSLAYASEENAYGCPASSPCKETHSFALPDGQCGKGKSIACDIFAHSTASFTAVYNASACETRTGKSYLDAETYAPDAYRAAACAEGRFLEATPSTDMHAMPHWLFDAMPSQLRPQTRFALILREPVERMLSWYNHGLADGNVEANMTFAAYAETQLQKEVEPGRYAEFIDAFLAAGWSRSQLLVLGFDELTATATKAAMERLTTHYGTPVLVDSPEMPVANAHGSPTKVVQITCDTRERIAAVYAPLNTRLYAMLEEQRTSGLSPSLETPLTPFEVTVPCGTSELTSQDVGEEDSASASISAGLAS